MKKFWLTLILSFLPIAGLLATEICLPCVEADMRPYCQALRDAGLLREGVASRDILSMANPESPACEQVLANWDVKRILDRIDLGVPHTPLTPHTPQSFCDTLQRLEIIGGEKQQACHDFYQTHPLPY